MYPEVTKIKHAKELLYNQFQADFGSELHVDKLEKGRIETYTTNHPNGALVVFYDGGKFSDSTSINIVRTNRDLRFVAFLKIKIEKGLTYRDDMIDAVVDSVSGLKFITVSKADRVRPSADEYATPEADGDKSFYDHPIVLIVPAQFVQKKHLNED